ncbi:hypothetical protein [Streptomyces sp. NPDC048309]|uniref:hypothetical protein n=1 Tax=Streptomyces sp. NPDC048309 TaxID=3154618 RepID=UPI0033DAA1AA
MALIECGTRSITDAAFDSIAGCSEHKLARRLLASLRPGMLLLARPQLRRPRTVGPGRSDRLRLAWQGGAGAAFAARRERTCEEQHRGARLVNVSSGHQPANRDFLISAGSQADRVSPGLP